MKIGSARIRPVIEIEDLQLPIGMFVGDLAVTDLAPHMHWLAPQYFDEASSLCRLSQHAWLIEANGKRNLVDPCVGHQRSRPALSFYDMIDSPMLDRLNALGVPPESVDYVFCTHLHLDHVGWNTRLQDGEYVPTFPNARYLFSRAEEEYWRREMNGEVPEEAFNSGVYAECIRPVIEAGLADLVDPGDRIAGCLTMIDAAGHTIGHIAGVIESGGGGVVLAGDALHHPVQVLFPDAQIHGYDEGQGRQTRHRLLDLCADKDFWLAPAHFRAPHMCKIRKDAAGYRMEWGPGI